MLTKCHRRAAACLPQLACQQASPPTLTPTHHPSPHAPGASVAINGTCLTVTEQRGPVLRFDVMAETLRRTNLGTLDAGSTVNFERRWVWTGRMALAAPNNCSAQQGASGPPASTPRRARPGLPLPKPLLYGTPLPPACTHCCSARVGDEIGGHTVSGHVHTTAKIVKVTDTENNRRVEFQVGGAG